MKTILIAMLLAAAPAFAQVDADGCHMVKVCELKKPVAKKKAVKKPSKVVTIVASEPKLIKKEEPKPVVAAKPRTAPAVKKEVKKAPAKVVEKESDWSLGLHAALGLGPELPNSSALLGLRGRYKPFHLGLEAYTAFDYGEGVQLLVYTVQGRLSHHFNAGFLFPRGTLLSTTDVPRTWDLTVGTGLEFKLIDRLSLTADWRAALPSPVFMAAPEQAVAGEDGRYMDVKHVIGNTLTQSQIMVGLLFHFL